MFKLPSLWDSVTAARRPETASKQRKNKFRKELGLFFGNQTHLGLQNEVPRQKKRKVFCYGEENNGETMKEKSEKKITTYSLHLKETLECIFI